MKADINDSGIINARFVFTADSSQPILRDRMIVRENGINAFRPVKSELSDEKYRHRVILPLLVNAHTHLELSLAEGEIPEGLNFVLWLKRLLILKKTVSRETALAAMRKALRKSWQNGTGILIDICNDLSFWEITQPPHPEMRIFVYHELLGFKSEAADLIFSEGKRNLKKLLRENNNLQAALTPHSAYSCSAELTEKIQDDTDYPVSVHLSEHRAEMELFEKKSGDMVQFLKEIGSWRNDWRPFSPSPLEHLHNLNLLKQGDLAVHLVNISKKDIALLRKNSIIPVLCPRSNLYYGNGLPPVTEMLESGLMPLLGTDSLASNNSLNMLDEIREAIKRWPEVKLIDILNMATINIKQFAPFRKESDRFFPLAEGKKQPLLELIFKRPVEDLKESLLNDSIVERNIIINTENP